MFAETRCMVPLLPQYFLWDATFQSESGSHAQNDPHLGEQENSLGGGKSYGCGTWFHKIEENCQHELKHLEVASEDIPVAGRFYSRQSLQTNLCKILDTSHSLFYPIFVN